MEDNGLGLFDPPVEGPSELEMLQKEHEEKTLRAQELKRQIECIKLQLEKAKKEVPEEKKKRKEAFERLSVKYGSMREEYNTLLADKTARNG